MNLIKVGVIGVGGMGANHAKLILEDKVPGAQLAAVCDQVSPKEAQFGAAQIFSDSAQLIRSGKVDAVIIATPHYSHTMIGIDALQQGLHVLVEKPISVHKTDCQRLLAAHQNPKQIFAAMFNQRTDPFYLKIRHLIQSGELGEIRRVNWIITDWFRSQAYYSSGGWRATWAGEGGGVLLNQCPHNLDLYQWLFGMPQRVRAFCTIGRYHEIEVEDDVTAYMEHPGGLTAVFIASTGEAPGTNRLEITAERGRVVLENGRLEFLRNEREMSEFCRTTATKFDRPEIWKVEIPLTDRGSQHLGIIKNFISAIREGKPLIAPAAEGVHSVELANAMLLSGFQDQTISLPIDAKSYEAVLKKKVAESTFVKKEVPVGLDDDFNKSFSKS